MLAETISYAPAVAMMQSRSEALNLIVEISNLK